MYQNGKIYKIVSDLTDMIYIGSTVQPLYKRHHSHIRNFKRKQCKSTELIKLGETRIELIEDYPCERKEQLNAREGYYIRLYKDICVNVRIEGRTKQEYIEDNKVKIAEIQKQYHESHKEKIAEREKQYREANKQKIAEKSKQYYEANKEKIAEREKQYKEANKEKITEQRKKYYEAKKANKLLQQV